MQTQSFCQRHPKPMAQHIRQEPRSARHANQSCLRMECTRCHTACNPSSLPLRCPSPPLRQRQARVSNRVQRSGQRLPYCVHSGEAFDGVAQDVVTSVLHCCVVDCRVITRDSRVPVAAQAPPPPPRRHLSSSSRCSCHSCFPKRRSVAQRLCWTCGSKGASVLFYVEFQQHVIARNFMRRPQNLVVVRDGFEPPGSAPNVNDWAGTLPEFRAQLHAIMCHMSCVYMQRVTC